MKSFLTTLLKWCIAALIFVFLFYRGFSSGSLHQFLEADKDWRFLGLGFLLSFAAVLITFIRWKWLNNAIGIPQSTRDAVFLGFIGYVFNFLPMGILGGDLVKGVLIARKNPDAKAACAVSVIIDRVIGLYVMFLVGFIAVTATGFYRNPNREAFLASRSIIWLSIVSTAGLLFLFTPGSRADWRRRFFQKFPCIGSLLTRLYDACARYRGSYGVLLVSTVATFFVHGLFSVGLWLIALGLWGHAPSLIDHFVIYPIANIGSMVPLSAGPLEFFLDQLYPLFPCTHGEPYLLGYGLLIGVVYRLITLVIAAVGGVYYLSVRSEIVRAMADDKTSCGSKNKEGGTP